MRVVTLAVSILAVCATGVLAAERDDCDCVRFPWEPNPPCVQICRAPAIAALAPGAYTYDGVNSVPRANIMASDATKEIYGQEFPLTTYGFPVQSSTLYHHPEDLGWTDVSTLPSKVGAIAVWPTMSGLVVEDDGDNTAAEYGGVKVLYPSDRHDGLLTVGEVRWLGRGTPPKFVVPTSALTLKTPDKTDPKTTH